MQLTPSAGTLRAFIGALVTSGVRGMQLDYPDKTGAYKLGPSKWAQKLYGIRRDLGSASEKRDEVKVAKWTMAEAAHLAELFPFDFEQACGLVRAVEWRLARWPSSPPESGMVLGRKRQSVM